MPGFHHAVLRAFRSDRQSVELSRQADGEVAYVDHLLNLPKPFRGDLATLDRDETAELGLACAQFLSQQSDQFATVRRWHLSPAQECFLRAPDGAAYVRPSRLVHLAEDTTGNRGANS